MEDILYDFISLSIKCPLCKTSLMDKEELVDGKPSIKLNVEVAGSKGTIRLSSIYESYNFRCDVDLPQNEIVNLSCPHCKENITSAAECEDCDAKMIPLLLDIGGKVSICSRVGCKNHFLEFEDVATSLKRLYQIGDLLDQLPEGFELEAESKELIETGTYLHSYCPHCNKTIIENGLVKFKVINKNDEDGFIYLSPYLNVFTSKSNMVIPEDKVVKDVKCFKCDTSLVERVVVCGECSSPTVKISVSARSKHIDFYLCSKKGCRWHGLDEKDLHDIDLEDSLEW
ncbi:MAG: class I tRNA ligase family protein [Bacteroidales bacterium]|nr:class I tRNA ligase family protein [Bacteroidales bacterium]